MANIARTLMTDRVTTPYEDMLFWWKRHGTRSRATAVIFGP